MTCDEVRQALLEDGEPSPERQQHVDACADCQAWLEVDALFRDESVLPPMPPALVEQVMAVVQHAPRRRAWGWEAGVAAMLAVAALSVGSTWVPVDLGLNWGAVVGYLQVVASSFNALSLPLTWPSLEVPLSTVAAAVALLVTMAGLAYLNVRAARMAWS